MPARTRQRPLAAREGEPGRRIAHDDHGHVGQGDDARGGGGDMVGFK